MRSQRLVAVLTALLLVPLTIGVVAAQSPCDPSTGYCVLLPVVNRAPNTPTPLPPTSTPVPQAVFFVSQNAFPRFGSLYVVGDVRNGLSGPVYFTKITVRFYDAADNLVAADYTYASLERISAGQTSPFKLILGNPPTNIDHYSLEGEYRTSSIFNRGDATVISQYVRNNSGVEVFGEIRNDTQATINYARVVVTFYDSQGKVLDTDWNFAASTQLAPGQISVYSVKTLRSDIDYVTYVVQAQGDTP